MKKLIFILIIIISLNNNKVFAEYRTILYPIDCWGSSVDPYDCIETSLPVYNSSCYFNDILPRNVNIIDFYVYIKMKQNLISLYFSYTLNINLNGTHFTTLSGWLGGPNNDLLLGQMVPNNENINYYLGATNILEINLEVNNPHPAFRCYMCSMSLMVLYEENPLEIIKPKNNDDFELIQGNYNQTYPVEFQAELIPTTIDTINWNVNLEYRTTGGKCSNCNHIIEFKNSPFEITPKTYNSMGGQAIVNAYAEIDEKIIKASPVKFTITGTNIPEALITSELISQYNGPTKRLMIGVADVESSYEQFSEINLYGRQDLWPKESYDGGSHIGLMQVEITMENAWDWLKNIKYGINLFEKQKVPLARIWERRIKEDAREKYKCHLRNLTNEELENIALVCYSPYASDKLFKQYYYYNVTQDEEGNKICEWIVNNDGNPSGVEYVNKVRTLMNNH